MTLTTSSHASLRSGSPANERSRSAASPATMSRITSRQK